MTLGRPWSDPQGDPSPYTGPRHGEADGPEDDRGEPPGAARLPAARADRGGPPAHRDRGEVAAGRARDARAVVRGGARRRGVAHRRRDRSVRPGQPREPRPDAATE